MALSAQQILDMRADLGIGASGAADEIFSDAELNVLYDRAGSDYNLAVYYGWRQILANSVKYIDYKVAQTSISRSQVFQHIKDMVAFWAAESKSADDQLLSAGLNQVPPKLKPKPADEYHHNGYFRRGRWYPYVS